MKTEEKDTLNKIRNIALTKAKNILSEMGISVNNDKYSFYLYEIQFKIYHAIKDTLKIDI